MNLGFSMEQINQQQHDQQHQPFNFGLNHQLVSSSASCHIFFNSTQDHAEFYHPQLYQPHHLQPEVDYYGYHGGSSYEIENKVGNGLKLSLWKKEDEVPAQSMVVEDGDRVKWMPRLMKQRDRAAATASIAAADIEVKKVKVKPSSSLETDLSSNSSSYNCNSPIRVCSDCHTTKTPLWRSGPKGPKSLCNACGIRQRKARRAMAAAGNGGDPPRTMKVKEKMGKSSGHSSQLKKRCKMGGGGAASGGGSSTSSGKKMSFEDFLINLSNKLAFHRVFPQDEKEAAILLMALSSGLVHG